ncbi:hypothetical protein SLS55_010433 [Diplodia seriata]|uniref:Cytochrome P450 n=1 Tax=Diplodia seriata TaxID=420778 RepID=A0ABR3BYH3_9PEZI
MHSSILSAIQSAKPQDAISLGTTLFLLTLTAITYLLVTCTYNIFFHPLRNIPGPFLARISRLWSRIGNLHGTKSHRIHAAHQTHGGVVRIGPNELSFASPAATKQIYASSDAAAAAVFAKEASFYRAKRIYHSDHLFSFRDAAAHRQRRKLLQRGFSHATMLEFEPHVAAKIAAMLDHWSRMEVVVDAVPWAHWLGFDVVYHLMFDADPGCVARRRSRDKELVPRALERWGPYVPGRVGGYFRDVRAWKAYCVVVVRRCRAEGTRTPFLRHVLGGKSDAFMGRELSDGEVAEECMGGLFGGSGTTANTFVYVLWAVLRRLAVMARLRDELEAAFADGGRRLVPPAVECAKLPYLQAVVNETLRCYPTIIATKPRKALRDTVVAGVSVPKGTIVGSQNYTVLRDPTAFPNPDNSFPERWLKEGGDELRREAFTPFSVGPRACIGINLAKMELNKLVAAFFLRFNAEVDESMREEDMRMYDLFSAGPSGGKLLIRLAERK